MKFRKRPVVIDAIRWDGTTKTLDAIADVSGDRFGRGVDGSTLLIATLEGVMTLRVGDWLIRGVAGEVYPCKHEIFMETYEPVDFEPAAGRGQAPDQIAPPVEAAEPTIPFMFGMGLHVCAAMNPDQPPTAIVASRCPFCYADLPRQTQPERKPEHGTDVVSAEVAGSLAKNPGGRPPTR